MDPLTIVAGVLPLLEATKKAKEYLQAVKTGPKELQQIAGELQSLQCVLESIADLSRKVEKRHDAFATSTLRRLADLEARDSPLALSFEEVEKLITLIRRSDWGPEGSKRRATSQALTWPFTRKQISSSLDTLERMKNMLLLVLDIYHLHLTLDTHGSLDDLKERLTNIKKEDLHNKIDQWLSAPAPLNSHHEARSKWHPTTGEWFINGLEYTTWKAEPNSLIWLNGITGCGKTILSSTVIEDLTRCFTLPSTIGETYTHVLCNIKHTLRNPAAKVFQWLALSVRPLKVEELVDVLAIDVLTKPRFHSSWRMPDPEDLLRVCTSLVTFTSSDCGQSSYVKLAHASVKDYLLSQMIKADAASQFAVDGPCVHAAICEACLSYLLVAVDDQDADSSIETKEGDATSLRCTKHLTPMTLEADRLRRIKDTYPLASYAANHWMDHAVLAGEQVDPLFPLIFDAFQPWAFKSWFLLHDQFEPSGQVLYRALATKHYSTLQLCLAVESGFTQLVKPLLEFGADSNSRPRGYHTVLQLATRIKNLGLMQLLIDYGADVNAPPGDDGMHALCFAANVGHIGGIDLLLDHGAAINQCSSVPLFDGYTPLIAAAREGHMAACQLLLSRGADVNGTRYYSPLIAALNAGHMTVVQLLLSYGANADTPDVGERHDYALHTAVLRKHEEIVRLLIEAGADVNAFSKDGNTALNYACRYGSRSIAQLLLDGGADIEGRSDNHSHRRTPLEEAVFEGHDSVVQLLLHRGAKLDSSLPEEAVFESHDSVVQFLPQSGAMIDLSLLEKLSIRDTNSAPVIAFLLQPGWRSLLSLRSRQKAFHTACTKDGPGACELWYRHQRLHSRTS
ncbi:MAG: hypothetical protein Q9182_005708 [Xanthomendoza sp. 2 TL-2023]